MGACAINTWVSDGRLQVRSRIPENASASPVKPPGDSSRSTQQQGTSSSRSSGRSILQYVVDSKKHFLGELAGIYFPGCSYTGPARAQGTGLRDLLLNLVKSKTHSDEIRGKET